MMGGIVPDDAPSSLPMAAMRRLAVSDMMKGEFMVVDRAAQR